MKLKDQYKNNKPLFNSILTGLFYFLFCWSLTFGEATKLLFMILMQFLPGLTFPLTTCYFNTEESSYSHNQRVRHLVISVLIYYGSVWLFSGEGHIKYITVLAGLLGSLFFLIMTRYLLKKNIPFTHILFSSLLCGLSFFQFESNRRQGGLFMGISVFLWTIINGIVLNVEYRKLHTSNIGFVKKRDQ